MLSKGTEMMLQAVITQLMNKVQIDPVQVTAYKALVENFFKSHSLLLASHQEIRSQMVTLQIDMKELLANQSNTFVCAHCGAEHLLMKGNTNDGNSGESKSGD